MRKIFTILGLAVLLSACGWQLRGSSPINDNGNATGAALSLALSAEDIYTPLYRTFKSDYENRRIDLTHTEHQLQLKLLTENIRSRILSLNTELDPAENELTYTLRYQITLASQPPQLYTVQLYRTYIQDKNRAIARDNEKNKLIDEMRHEAAERVLNQIRTLSYSHTNNTQ